MSSKLVPSDPEATMVIRNVTPNVVTLSVPFARFGMIPVGGRATVVKLTSGALAIFSPVALTKSAQAKLTEMGNRVEYIIAPDMEHHIFLTEWSEAFPNAKLIGPEGISEKREKAAGSDPKIGQHPKKLAIEFTKENKKTVKIGEDFDQDFLTEYVDGHFNKELVFCYKPDKILIEADFLWNLPATEQYSRVPEKDRKLGLAAKAFIGLQGTEGEAKGQKRFLWYGPSVKDKTSFNESVRVVDGWDFNTIVPCHGDVIQGNGKEVFEKVMEWHLKGTKH